MKRKLTNNVLDNPVTKKPTFYCNVCNIAYSTKLKWLQHNKAMTHMRNAKNQHPTNRNDYSCKICDRDFFSEKSYQMHVTTKLHQLREIEQRKHPKLFQLRKQYLQFAMRKCAHCYASLLIGSNNTLKLHIQSKLHQAKTQAKFAVWDASTFKHYPIKKKLSISCIGLPKVIGFIIIEYLDEDIHDHKIVMQYLPTSLKTFDEIVLKNPQLLIYALANISIPLLWFVKHLNLLEKINFKHVSSKTLRQRRYLFEMYPHLISYDMLNVSPHWYYDTFLPNLTQLWQFYWNPFCVSQEDKQRANEFQKKMAAMKGRDVCSRQVNFTWSNESYLEENDWFTNEYYYNLHSEQVILMLHASIHRFTPLQLRSLFSNDCIHLEFLEQFFPFVDWVALLQNPKVPIAFVLKHMNLILTKSSKVIASLLKCTVFVDWELKQATRLCIQDCL